MEKRKNEKNESEVSETKIHSEQETDEKTININRILRSKIDIVRKKTAEVDVELTSG